MHTIVKLFSKWAFTSLSPDRQITIFQRHPTKTVLQRPTPFIVTTVCELLVMRTSVFCVKVPFAVLANVLSRATSACALILNFADSDIDKCKILPSITNGGSLELALDQLRFN